MSLKIHILDDEERIGKELSEYLTHKGFSATYSLAPAETFAVLDGKQIDILILDIMMPELDGTQMLEKVKSKHPELEVIMISGHGDMDTVIKILRKGAADYLKKPFRMNELMIAIERTKKYITLQQNIEILKNNNSLISKELERQVEKNFIGESSAIKKVLQETIQVASFSDTPVIITGESGTGKEIVARIIHFASPRKNKKFFPVNCAAIPETLLESEFFGYKKGAFTGALQDKKGYFELTEGGTLFLDEIGDMPFHLQTKLMRVLEEKKMMKIGTNREIPIDIRFLVATNRDLEAMIQNNTFREDLYYRLAAYKIHIPPLRERPEDIVPLLGYYIGKMSRENKLPIPAIEPKLLQEIMHYSFPGNVRELKNLVERALIINRDGTLKSADFNWIFKPNFKEENTLENTEIDLIKKTLLAAKYNQTKAAKKLGISRYTLIRKMKKYGL